MRISERLEREGEFLFRWRSYLPLLLLPFLAAALVEAADILRGTGEFWHHLAFAGAISISLAGLALRAVTIGHAPAGTSGRNTHGQVAEVLNTTGLYSVVRNPLYLGNFLMILGVVLATEVWWLVAIVSLAFWISIERIIAAEERYLASRFGDSYRAWAERTPVFWPDWRLWRPAAQELSLRTILKREHYGLLGLATAFLASEALLDLLVRGEPVADWAMDDWPWIAFFVFAAFASVTLRLLKKRTSLLFAPGR